MPLTNWDETYELGIREIDDHHCKLVELLNSAYDLILTSSAKSEIQTILLELTRYTDYHFDIEEQMMKEAKFTGLRSHVAKHNNFKKQLALMMQAYLSDSYHVNTDIVLFLWDWLKEHILKDDRKLVTYLSKL